jgi:hypothetical protein
MSNEQKIVLDILEILGYEAAINMCIDMGLWQWATNLMLCMLGVPLDVHGQGNLFTS